LYGCEAWFLALSEGEKKEFQEQSAEENICVQEKGCNKRLEKIME
jgi:hypothetical protein